MSDTPLEAMTKLWLAAQEHAEGLGRRLEYAQAEIDAMERTIDTIRAGIADVRGEPYNGHPVNLGDIVRDTLRLRADDD